MPGSYGLLYIQDEIDHSNEFVVWKLARGHLNQEKDPFLSPCISSIENSFDPLRANL
ncbi:Imm7 family immunity protein [Leptospira interrogans]|uniref:Imm7 family immunity protein n=1 Tax=Leptospira interrogans TaxID=173 RepID=UPI000772FE93|nr:Imm7 family immunity protein [Leptospira interrogans]